jgi:hypothetical protein
MQAIFVSIENVFRVLAFGFIDEAEAIDVIVADGATTRQGVSFWPNRRLYAALVIFDFWAKTVRHQRMMIGWAQKSVTR